MPTGEILWRPGLQQQLVVGLRGNVMHSDHDGYFKFTRRSRIDKAVNSLLGLVEGVSIDGAISSQEVEFLRLWIQENSEVRTQHPFSELMPVVNEAISDGILSEDERMDILWLCERLRSTDYFDLVTADIQRLHGIMAGITADEVISADELRGLSVWLSDHEHLRMCWPYDEVDSMITQVMADGKIDREEHDLLAKYFLEFVAILDKKTIVRPKVLSETSLTGLCAVCPMISFVGSSFCFTGASKKYSRTEFGNVVRLLGGNVVSGVSADVDFLVIGANGNPCWAFACYGRKVEKAVELRKQGARLQLVHEYDFHDAVEDLS
ncbi:MAG: hypothetical protein ACYC6Y_30345 [Thermoguttaceae bacterium]